MLPPKNDPHRRRVVASRMLALGGLLHLIPIGIAFTTEYGDLIFICLVVFGTIFVISLSLAYLLAERRFWALVTALSLCSLELVLPLICTCWLIYQFNPDAPEWRAMTSVAAAFDVLLITQIILLGRCSAAFQYDRMQNLVGFVPIVQPLAVIPIEE